MNIKKFFIFAFSCLFTFTFLLIPISAKDEEYIYDEYTKGNGYEDYYVDYDPKLREYYGGYQRNGSFMLFNNSNGKVYNATQLKVEWKSGGGTIQKYLVNGNYMQRSSTIQAREIDSYEPTNFVLLQDSMVYSAPFGECELKNKKVLKGTYVSTRRSVDFTEIMLEDGTKVWVNPQYTPYFQTKQLGFLKELKIIFL